MKCRVWGWSFPNYLLCTFTSIPNGQSASSIYCLRFRAKMPCHFLGCVVLCQSRCCARSRNAKASESLSMGDLMWIFSLITYTSDCYLSNQKLLLSASFAEAPLSCPLPSQKHPFAPVCIYRRTLKHPDRKVKKCYIMGVRWNCFLMVYSIAISKLSYSLSWLIKLLTSTRIPAVRGLIVLSLIYLSLSMCSVHILSTLQLHTPAYLPLRMCSVCVCVY